MRLPTKAVFSAGDLATALMAEARRPPPTAARFALYQTITLVSFLPRIGGKSHGSQMLPIPRGLERIPDGFEGIQESEMGDIVPALSADQVLTYPLMEKPMNVYIWDLDETLILLRSLLNGSYAGAFDGLKDSYECFQIGKQWENIIIELCNEHFFFDEMIRYNEPYLNALSEFDDGRDLASFDFEADCFASFHGAVDKRRRVYRLHAIGEKYVKGLEKILDQDMLKVSTDLYDLTDKYTDGWLTSAHKLLEDALGKSAEAPAAVNSSSIHCIVTAGALIPCLAKCLLYRLDDVVSSENVYSSLKVGKLQCFKWIKERFDNPNVRFCVIGDGREEFRAAQTMKWPFIKIEFPPDAPHRFPGLDMPTVQAYMDAKNG
ncbi:hypothetical protein U9M48_030132 [Paspalum notatum var. saurae]|uniref:protein-tyrosine-phosphatase n=1 Tax=Paspalum notatum var. saurae TaxID=547442 RepID=A0AAQ3U2C9_PASNO